MSLGKTESRAFTSTWRMPGKQNPGTHPEDSRQCCVGPWDLHLIRRKGRIYLLSPVRTGSG